MTESDVVKDNKPPVDLAMVSAWLGTQFGEISDCEALTGGFWSAAFAFSTEGQQRVARFSKEGNGFRIDQLAHKFAVTGLPVPEVYVVGEALGCQFAISERLPGRFLEDITTDDVTAVSGALAAMFSQMRAVPSADRVEWYEPESRLSWHDYLLGSLVDEGPGGDRGVADLLGTRPDVAGPYQAAVARIHELLPLIPERRDLVHGDLLHRNVLVSASAESVTAVFSWKCSAFGDFLHDIAWCTHWSPWYPGIALIDFPAMVSSAADLDRQDLHNAAARHHCYELQIAASHVGWYLWTRDEENLSRLIANITMILGRGPLEFASPG